MKVELNRPSGFREEDVCKCRWTDARVIDILLDHQRAFGSGELKQVVIARKCHYHISKINLWHHEEKILQNR